MSKLVIKTGILLVVIASFCGCDTVNMLNCSFEKRNVDNFSFAGIGFDKINSISDINILTDGATILSALSKGTAPITFNLNVEGKNPNKSVAAIEQMDWKVLVDEAEFLGSITEKFSIPAEGTSILPIEIGFDAMSFIDGNTPESIFNLYQNITGKNASKESNASLKIKPTINGFEFPNYITLNQTIN
jgi:hypothetical protein